MLRNEEVLTLNVNFALFLTQNQSTTSFPPFGPLGFAYEMKPEEVVQISTEMGLESRLSAAIVQHIVLQYYSKRLAGKTSFLSFGSYSQIDVGVKTKVRSYKSYFIIEVL